MKYYALDSNIITYYLKKNTKIMDKIDNERQKGNKLIIPPMVYYESIRGLIYLNATTKLKLFNKLCSNGVGIINKDILDIAVSIYITLQKKGITIGDNDILIAAFCLKHNLVLITNNTKHFENINGLITENWV
ncbi:MAG: PIN domain-containing protein [Treponema sp.]|jgi:tRNA(fMet)-specific endonuclease VapC|nr:PIN domain-containing protein [Treponema sp.]